jgi:hypothetical protein
MGFTNNGRNIGNQYCNAIDRLWPIPIPEKHGVANRPSSTRKMAVFFIQGSTTGNGGHHDHVPLSAVFGLHEYTVVMMTVNMKTRQIYDLLQGRERECVCVWMGPFECASVSQVKVKSLNRAHKNPPMDLILSQMNPVTIPTSRLLKL